MTEYNEVLNQLIPIDPFGKARPRVTRNGTYMPPAYQRNIELVQMWIDFTPEPDQLYRVSVIGWRKIPRTGPNSKRERGEYCTAKPDVDNLAGAIMDALFVNDNFVVELSAAMLWGTSASIHVIIEEIMEA